MVAKRETLSVTEAAQVLGISRGLAYDMARTGKLPTIRFGKRLVVPRRALERMLEEPQGVSDPDQEGSSVYKNGMTNNMAMQRRSQHGESR